MYKKTISEIQMGEVSNLGWLMGFVKHIIWADFLYFLYQLLLSISRNPDSIPDEPMTLPVGMLS
jgi:hypothetical protein